MKLKNQNDYDMKKNAIIIGGSKGIGQAIAESLAQIGCEVIATSRVDVDTGNQESVRAFSAAHPETDILVLNTGGPPKKNFNDITEDNWKTYHQQLFLGLITLLQKIHIRDNGYIFAITSYYIKEPSPTLILSNAYRTALAAVLKSVTKEFARRQVTVINIAPGPIKTDRLKNLVSDMSKLEESLPLKRAGNPEEIGNFVKSIVENNIKYLNGVTINFDGGASNYIF